MSFIYQQRKRYISEWAAELSEKLGRSAQELEARGLNASDFPLSGRVKITFPDGSQVDFNHAFYIISKSKSAIGVFTEHCGYHAFPLSDAEISYAPSLV